MVRFFSWLFVLIAMSSSLKLSAQDPQFSQYYAAPMYLNPALVGIHQRGSAGINYRNQWPAIAAKFETYSFYIDYNFEDVNSSLGLILNTDREGIVGLQSTNIGLQYAYQVRLNQFWTFRPAMEVAYYWRDVNFDKLTFGDQFDETGQVRSFTGEVFDTGLEANFLDLSAGGIIFNPKVWLGFSMHHLTEPNQSLTGDETPLWKRVSIHGGYKIFFSQINPLSQSKRGREWSLTPSFNFKDQDEYQQLDLGVYMTMEPVLLGLWYRGIPIKQFEGTVHNEAIIVMVGLKMGKTTMGYSFDYTISDLGIDSGGAHEISINYAFDLSPPNKPSQEVRAIKCPVPFIF